MSHSGFNMEALRAARVLLKEVSSWFHQEDMSVIDWGHGFVYHPSEIIFTRALQDRFPPINNAGRWGAYISIGGASLFSEA